jgi:hypothetical protein
MAYFAPNTGIKRTGRTLACTPKKTEVVGKNVACRILKVQSQEKTVFPFDFYLLLFDFASKTPCNLLFSFF